MTASRPAEGRAGPAHTGAAALAGLFGWGFVTAIAAATGALASVQAAEFYAQLVRPSWSPPGFVFGPVWTLLYAMLALAAWFVWRERGFRGAAAPLALFAVQLALNALWSWLFFAWRQGGAAFAEIVVLWIAIALTLRAFRRVRRLAGALLVPYLLWVTFAAALNLAIWRANPGAL